MKNIHEDFGIMRALSPFIHSDEYKKAKKTLSELLKKKKDNKHDTLYYAAQVAKSYPNVDARKLAAMFEEFGGMVGGSPVNNVGSGNIAGLGIGPQGEPGVNLKKKRKVIPFKTFTRR